MLQSKLTKQLSPEGLDTFRDFLAHEEIRLRGLMDLANDQHDMDKYTSVSSRRQEILLVKKILDDIIEGKKPDYEN